MNRKKVTILGAGPGGYVAAVRAAQNGCDVTVIDRDGAGGVCLRHGCIPVKSLLASARVYSEAKSAGVYGVTCDSAMFDYSKMSKRKSDIVAINEKGTESLFKRHNINFIRGTGKILSSSQVTCVQSDGSVAVFESDAVVIATGSSSFIPHWAALDNDRIFDCEGALARKTLPQSCIILGGGILGCEFASLFADLGVRVTIVEQQGTLLPGWDDDLSAALMRSFKRRKITMQCGSSVVSAAGNGSETVTVSFTDGSSADADTCLVALGRKPNTNGIGIENIGVALNSSSPGGIAVDSAMRTSVAGVYAVGDVTGIRMLAHVASAQGIAAADDIAGKSSPVRYDAVPDCFWANPECASVGMTERAAKERGIGIASSTVQFRALGIAHALGTIEGFVKTVIEKGTEKILGIHICGRGAPDMIAECSVIVNRELTVGNIEETIHAHPTLGEIVKESILAAAGRNIHG